MMSGWIAECTYRFPFPSTIEDAVDELWGNDIEAMDDWRCEGEGCGLFEVKAFFVTPAREARLASRSRLEVDKKRYLTILIPIHLNDQS